MSGWMRFGLFLLVLCTFGYMLPAAIAILRNHNSTIAIILVNVLLGWTIIFWVVSFFWSINSNAREKRPLGEILNLN